MVFLFNAVNIHRKNQKSRAKDDCFSRFFNIFLFLPFFAEVRFIFRGMMLYYMPVFP